MITYYLYLHNFSIIVYVQLKFYYCNFTLFYNANPRLCLNIVLHLTHIDFFRVNEDYVVPRGDKERDAVGHASDRQYANDEVFENENEI